MGRKPKKKIASKPSAKTESVKSSEVRPSITASKLKSLMSTARSAQKNINEISGGLGSEIKQAVEKNHLHRKAFTVIRQLDRMEPEKLADFLDCFEHYLDISGLQDRANQVQRMDLRDGEEGEDGEEVDKSNVQPFPKQTAVAAE